MGICHIPPLHFNLRLIYKCEKLILLLIRSFFVVTTGEDRERIQVADGGAQGCPDGAGKVETRREWCKESAGVSYEEHGSAGL